MPDDNFHHYFEELLARCTRRNQQTVTRHLESLCNIIRGPHGGITTLSILLRTTIKPSATIQASISRGTVH